MRIFIDALQSLEGTDRHLCKVRSVYYVGQTHEGTVGGNDRIKSPKLHLKSFVPLVPQLRL
jgi:hypothetical protein